jgi:hypothetical protein
MGYISEIISVSDTGWFTEEEVGIDLNGSMLCPVCRCCCVKQAAAVPDFINIFDAAAYWASGKMEETKEFRLVCISRCRRGQPHLRAMSPWDFPSRYDSAMRNLRVRQPLH